MKCQSYYRFFETVSTPMRWEIMELLQKKSLSVTEICESLKEEQSKVSHNLKTLSRCHVIEAKKDGKKRIYSLNKETILPLIQLIHSHVASCCGKECGVKI